MFVVANWDQGVGMCGVMVIWYLIYVGVIWGHYICDGNSLGLMVIA